MLRRFRSSPVHGLWMIERRLEVGLQRLQGARSKHGGVLLSTGTRRLSLRMQVSGGCARVG
jgi:hypothetical protein